MSEIFRIEPAPTFVHPVALPVPGGLPVTVRFRFRHMDGDAFFAMLAESREQKEPADAFLLRFVDGWEGENINAPFSAEALGKLVKNYPKAAKAIFAAFEAELVGVLEKN